MHLGRVSGERRRIFVWKHLGARGHFVSTVRRDEQAVREYIRNQEQVAEKMEQMKPCIERPPLGGYRLTKTR